MTGIGAIPTNLDVTFRMDTGVSPDNWPSPLLLHYIYGATTLKWWGHIFESYYAYLASPETHKRLVEEPDNEDPFDTSFDPEFAFGVDVVLLDWLNGPEG